MGAIMACEIVIFNLKKGAAVSAACIGCKVREPAAAAFVGTMPMENNNS
jgi:hypothetical protein